MILNFIQNSNKEVLIMKRIITIIVFILLTTHTVAQSAYSYKQPKETTDGWKTDHLRSQGIDSILIYNLFNQLTTVDHKIHSVLLIKNKKLVIEEYFNDHNQNKIHDLRSSTKSIRSILLGIAIDKGFINDINDPISKYLKKPKAKKNLDPRKEKITIKHLITMSSGLDCNDWNKKSKGQEDKVYKKKDWLQYTLDLPMINTPGELSNYCSMGVVLMVEVISQASGMSITEFADKYLFNPLGITNVKWGHTSNKKVIDSAKRLYLTSRDMAKIGQLVLNKGQWNSTRIISEKWITESTTPKVKISNIDYGYLWWNIPFVLNNKKINSITATGNGGQYIMIIPEFDIVGVFTGGAYNSEEDKVAFSIMNNIFIPSIQSEK